MPLNQILITYASFLLGSGITEGEKIGEKGGFGVVRKGTWNGIDVALKQFTIKVSEKTRAGETVFVIFMCTSYVYMRVSTCVFVFGRIRLFWHPVLHRPAIIHLIVFANLSAQ